MADIRRVRARKSNAEGNIESAWASFDTKINGLVFKLKIGDMTVSLSHAERDKLVRDWAASEAYFESQA